MKHYQLLTENLWSKAAALFLALLLALLIAFISIYQQLHTPIGLLENSDTALKFDVNSGSSLGRVSQDLIELRLINNQQIFHLLARWRGVENAIKVGQYEFTAGLSEAQLLDLLVQGSSKQYKLTLLEGWTFGQALEAIWQSEEVIAELENIRLNDIPKLLETPFSMGRENPEGLLFPDTYFYTAGTSDLEIIRRAHRRLLEVLDKAWAIRLGALPYESSYEALVMASIIEKESGKASERDMIAGVFIKRLELGMRLQSDPTVIYGMGDRYQGNIRRSDLQESNDYNTYRISGLPPTPIAMAGEKSITASLRPLDTGALYFVSKGDGSHYFSATLDEHNDAVRQYQLSQ